MKKLLTTPLSLILLMILGSAVPLLAQKLYTGYNIWYEKPQSVYCINYQKGTFVRAGSEVRDVTIKKNRLSFTVVGSGEKITIAFNARYHSKDVTVETLKERLITTKTFEQLTGGLKPFEIEAIRQGTVVKGMSKKAVLLAFGYPPEHKTPSLDGNSWMFWKNRFVFVTVPFDKDGSVSQDIK